MKQRIYLGIIVSCILVLNPGKSEAADDLLPGKSIFSPSHNQYPRDAYILDEVPPDDPEWPDQAVQVLHVILQAIWSFYLWVVEFVMRIALLSYDDALLSKLFAFVGSIMPQIIDGIWNPLWFLVAGIGIFSIILMWMNGNTNRSLTALSALVILTAVTPLLITSLPSYLDQANRIATSVSSDLMGRMLVRSKNSLEKSTTAQQSQKIIADTIWDSLAKQPYLVINFGSVSQGKKYFSSLMEHGTERGKRISKLREWGKIDAETGVAKNKMFTIFTFDGSGERSAKLYCILLLITVPIYLMVAMSIMILIWKARAVGRSLFFIFDGLLSLYPNYGVRHVMQSVVQVFSAILMVIIYSTALSIFFALWTRLLKAKPFGSASFADQVFLILLLIVGLWTAAKELSGRFGDTNNLSGKRGLLTRAFMGAQLFRTVTRNPISRWVTKNIGKSRKESAKLIGTSLSKTGKAVKNYVSQVDTVQKMRSHVKAELPLGRMKSMQPERMQLTTNLSKRGQKVFQEMKRQRLAPTHKKDVISFLRRNPHLTSAVQEMIQWQNRRPYEQVRETHVFDGSQIPMEPPQKHTPEYHTWMQVPEYQHQYKLWLGAEKSVRHKRWQEYYRKKIRYDRSPIRRLFMRRPKWVEPTQREALQEYRRLLQQQKKGGSKK
ncbi:hypothetical protein SAMN05444392_11160 [Seinonella peptonophila]|uniref:TrbL/VirB6 plasmid conjugal transfer protein n=1 Tax=Seinonella peptonophila TaxID=112248 RepID=A0A1M4ZZ78_9BACL|nr:hypothetical protein [Seinonella peptonophila]SHF23308.1 hypothetical protein SAMN05444392_11160 [Seinonella peptonophila]